MFGMQIVRLRSTLPHATLFTVNFSCRFGLKHIVAHETTYYYYCYMQLLPGFGGEKRPPLTSPWKINPLVRCVLPIILYFSLFALNKNLLWVKQTENTTRESAPRATPLARKFEQVAQQSLCPHVSM